MGVHHRPLRQRQLLPWAVGLIGIGLMIGFMVAAYVVPLRETSGSVPVDDDFARPPPRPASLLPSPTDPDETEAAEDDGEGEEAVRGLAATSCSPTPTPDPNDAAPDSHLVGEYRVDKSFPDTFIGRVAIVNDSLGDRDWQVELAFCSDVGELNSHWVEGTPQPTRQRSGERHVFAGAVPVPGQSRVVLNVHFDRYGAGVYPSTCTVNGTACAISR